MKKLVIFYSFEGNTRYIAEQIAETINADLLELKPKKEIKKSKFMKYVWGGKQVVLGAKPELEQLDKNPQQYDMIILGTPVWAFSYTPAFKTFFSQVKLKGKKIALFCCSGGGKGKTFNNMKQELEGNEIIGEIELIEPIKDNKEAANKAKGWAFNLLREEIQ